MNAAREIISALVAAGMDAVDAAALVARAVVEMVPPADTRSPGARRQAVWRERLKTSQNVSALQSDEASQNVSNRNKTSQSNGASLSKENSNLENKESKRGANRGSRLPDDWRPSAIDWAIAVELIGEERSRTEFEKFKDHWKQQPGSKGVKLDWAAAWRNWTRRAAEYGGHRNGHGISNHRTVPDAGRATSREAHQVATMGGAALRFLKEGKSAGRVGDISGGPGFAEEFDAKPAAKDAH